VPEAVREALPDAPPPVAEAPVESTVDPSAVTRDVSAGPPLGEEAGEGLDLEGEDWKREDRAVGDDMGGSPVAVASGWPLQTSGEPPQTV
jgi:hypothetical protein